MIENAGRLLGVPSIHTAATSQRVVAPLAVLLLWFSNRVWRWQTGSRGFYIIVILPCAVVVWTAQGRAHILSGAWWRLTRANVCYVLVITASLSLWQSQNLGLGLRWQQDLVLLLRGWGCEKLPDSDLYVRSPGNVASGPSRTPALGLIPWPVKCVPPASLVHRQGLSAAIIQRFLLHTFPTIFPVY